MSIRNKNKHYLKHPIQNYLKFQSNVKSNLNNRKQDLINDKDLPNYDMPKFKFLMIFLIIILALLLLIIL